MKSHTHRTTIAAVLAALGLAVGLAGVPLTDALAQSSSQTQPADKIGVAASVIEVMKAQVGPGGGASEPITLLTATVKNSNPADLEIKVTHECAIWTDVVVSGTGTSESAATVKTWIEIDGQPVPVTADSNNDGVFNDPDDGRVVFCNRSEQLSLTSLQPSEMIRLFEKSRSANAFNWVKLNVGSGSHTITVKARLEVNVDGFGRAQAAVGKRTLVIEPSHLANNIEF